VEIHPPHPAAHSFRDFAIQLVTITAGVLIALSFEGVREWRHDRALVREARENIRLEIEDNKKDVEAVQRGVDARNKQLTDAIQFASEIIATKKTSIRSVGLSFELADRVSSAAWQTAERTGALAHMDYAEVQKYSRLYSFQDLYIERQRRAIEALSLAMGPLSASADPTTAPVEDIEDFRRRVVDLQSLLTLEEQFAKRLLEAYDEALRE
jgi:hypothetical protein